MEMSKTLLEKRRIGNGWSKRELARRAGFDAAIVSYAENRGFRLYPKQLAGIAKAFGISEAEAEELLTEVEA